MDLDRVIDTLASRFPHLDHHTVAECVYATHAGLQKNATINSHLVALTQPTSHIGDPTRHLRRIARRPRPRAVVGRQRLAPPYALLKSGYGGYLLELLDGK